MEMFGDEDKKMSSFIAACASCFESGPGIEVAIFLRKNTTLQNTATSKSHGLLLLRKKTGLATRRKVAFAIEQRQAITT